MKKLALIIVLAISYLVILSFDKNILIISKNDNELELINESLQKRKAFFIQACQIVKEESQAVIEEIDQINNDLEFDSQSKFHSIAGLDDLRDDFVGQVDLMEVKLKRLETTKLDKIDNDLISKKFYEELSNKYEIAVQIRVELNEMRKKIESRINNKNKIRQARYGFAPFFIF